MSKKGASSTIPPGRVRGIWIAAEAAAPMKSIEAVRAEAGRGLEGDRYFLQTGAFSRWPGPRRQLTLIASEAISVAAAEAGGDLSPAELRRNVVTESIDLGMLMGKEFSIGALRLRGLKLALPCGYLERLSGRDNLRAILRNGRGGIRAELLSDGWIRVGDPIVLQPISGAREFVRRAGVDDDGGRS